MSGFDPDWLALREAYDHAVRDAALTARFVDALGPEPRLIDLGAGTGSNLRFLASRLPPSQRWTCVDYDPLLLQRLAALKPAGIAVTTLQLDLQASLEDLPIGRGTGVTAAALLDLASAAWLERLASCCRENPMLMTLSFDGRIIADPVDEDDEAIIAAFCRHQRTDKGFGPALGPDAVPWLADFLRTHGREVALAGSDWVFGLGDEPIMTALIDGFAAAAAEIDPALPVERWRAEKRAAIAEGRLKLTVGHLDLLALP